MIFFFRDHHSAARRENQLENAARQLKSLPTPALDHANATKYVLIEQWNIDIKRC